MEAQGRMEFGKMTRVVSSFCIAEFDVTIIFIASLSPWCVFLGEI